MTVPRRAAQMCHHTKPRCSPGVWCTICGFVTGTAPDVLRSQARRSAQLGAWLANSVPHVMRREVRQDSCFPVITF
ncbi:uncharacterized protein PHACADRAFT_261068 [Phanerochaete carnosa HHB-10118-sp]|uniref:Uncharacterized protein n=1 Tax=Phanerochaete carnosa (strain HHB-10118-sp) TaxID=650164 RepID=K5W103_PHACS|nr:uncharacterized protein PHACADRAFT_261068 [Phanerochaete carnosa HHB-10118-sp]EKM52569.1 hypothetical protein PHACADRAFT_261068 [Phanerochaete carnosa HHB-10118-sp]